MMVRRDVSTVSFYFSISFQRGIGRFSRHWQLCRPLYCASSFFFVSLLVGLARATIKKQTKKTGSLFLAPDSDKGWHGLWR